MRKIREILRLKWGHGLSQRAVARSMGIGQSTVGDCVARAKKAGLSWPLDPELDDAALERKLYPPAPPASQKRFEPDWSSVHRELKRKGVTLQLLWEEYKADHPDDGYQYSQFCARYRRFKGALDPVMRQEHRAGDKMFGDWSGDGIEIVDRATGEVTEAPLFVAVLGASSYTFAYAEPSLELRCWIDAHIHSFEFFEGVPRAVVVDNTKTAVTRPCYYEPELNPTYWEMAQHYDTVVLPTRVRHPKDNAKAESGVLQAQRRILAALRNHTFFTIDQANVAIAEKVQALNERPLKRLGVSRRHLYETVDRPALKPLPSARYQFAEWSKPKVNIDYHVEVDGHLYSVPHALYGERLDARRTAGTVEIFFKGRRVASHARSYRKGHTTRTEHMPKSHRRYAEWTPQRILRWAAKTGQSTHDLCEKILNNRPHPEQGFRSCLGLFRLGRVYGTERLEAACKRALALEALSYRSVENILKNKLENQPLPSQSATTTPATPHDNLRGPEYYN